MKSSESNYKEQPQLQTSKQTTGKQFYFLDTIRTLPGKYGVSVVYWWDRAQSKPMTTLVQTL